MPSLTIRDIPEDLHVTLRQEAAANGRSINKEVLLLLRTALVTRRQKDPGENLRRAQALRKRMKGVWIDEEFLQKAKSEGRA